MILCSCRDLPVRIDSAVKPSRAPVVETAGEQDFTEYARQQGDRLLNPHQDDEEAPSDLYSIYRRGGRDFIRHFFRELRDQELAAPKISSFGEVRLELARIFPLIGWKVCSSHAPQPLPAVSPLPELDPMRRAMFFEAGMRVKGGYQKTAEGTSLELIYKVVHEKGEPLGWLERDEWSTRLRFDLRNADPHHQLLWITREVGPKLYEEPSDDQKEVSSLLLSWDREGSYATFRILLMTDGSIQSLSITTDQDQQIVEIRHEGF
jgi:hypothetical protein